MSQQDEWKRVRIASEQFEPRAVVTSEDGVFVGGSMTDRAVVFHYRTQPRLVLEREGWVVAMEARGERVWVITGAHGREPKHVLFFSEDRGASWTEVGPVPAEGVGGLASRGETLWAYGVRGILRSQDGGTSWTSLDAPFPPGLTTRIVAAGPDRIVAFGPGWAESRDGGDSWRVVTRDAGIGAIDGDWVLARRGERAHIGRVEGDEIVWTAEMPQDGDPRALAVRGDRMRALLHPMPVTERSVVLEGWVVADTRDGGESFEIRRAVGSMVPMNRTAALAAPKSGFLAGRRGELVVLE